MINIGIDIGSDTIKTVILTKDNLVNPKQAIELKPIKIAGKPLERLKQFFLEIKKRFLSSEHSVCIGLTGSGASKVSSLLDTEYFNEIDAVITSINHSHNGFRGIIEIGAESQKYILLYQDPSSGKLLLEDIVSGGKCAGGTGSFLDYMCKRLKFSSMEEFINVALKVETPATISGRCAVFAESDIVHHYQKGTPKERIAAGVHQAVVRNYRSLIRKAKLPSGVIAFIGGVSRNKCIQEFLIRELGLSPGQLSLPEKQLTLAAHGAALKATKPVNLNKVINILEKQLSIPFEYEATTRIQFKLSQIMPPLHSTITEKTIPFAALGVDIGSVSTKAVLLVKKGKEYIILASHYRRTDGNPIEAVKKTLEKINKEITDKDYQIEKIVAATTGSGRYLTGYFIGADIIKDEITAQASGATAYIEEDELSIIEIGGQDSKYIKLEGGSIIDFEMNWACAAGTGALIEKHAKNLDIEIEQFGDYALRGEKPPIINSTCAVFSELALIYYQQNNVSQENLCAGACIASARNYLTKVVRNRKLSKNIAFQGAVAFNKGMVGALETILQRKIIIPPYPHLTGAIGVARIAYERFEQAHSKTKFRGFQEILNSCYKLSSFQCKQCGNECHVNKFEVGEETFFQGDRCDRYSSRQKKSQGDHLPDLFWEREQILNNIYTRKLPPIAPRIGIPRGLLFNDYFPLFKAFFSELGFQVITSEKTNKKIINKSLEYVFTEPCFPIKVAHGHVVDVIEKEIDYLFMPTIITAESPLGGLEDSTTCPYIQAGPDMIRETVKELNSKVKILSPTFFFDRGKNHLRRVLTQTGKKLGKNREEVNTALEVALKVYTDYKRRIQERGREVLASLRDDQLAFVIIGRPYAIYDQALNMNIPKKIRDEGFLAIPMDFLPLDEVKLFDHWPNLYPFQGQKKLAAARLISQTRNLQAVVITYFGCGPDAFIDHMFKEELGRQYLTIQIDEHTSDTGVITRIQAYLGSAHFKDDTISSKKRINTSESSALQIRGKRLWIPYMSEAAKILASTLRAYGVDAQVLPRSPDPGLSLARNYISGDVCLPMLHTTEDMLYRVTQSDFQPEKEAFFQGKSHGPCRYGMYYMLQKLILDKLKENVDIVTIGNINRDGGLGTFFTMMAWDAMVAYDMLEKMLLHTRPYEVNPGESDRLFLHYVDEICKFILNPKNIISGKYKTTRALLGCHLGELIDILKEAQKKFSQIAKKEEKKPKIGVVGEFYVRFHEPSNQSIVRKLESMGAEVWLAPMTEFFGYCNYITGVSLLDKWKDSHSKKDILEVLKRRFLNWLGIRDERKLYHATLPYLREMPEITPAEVVELGAQYLNKLFGGEAILSIGKSEDFARRELDGIVNVGPFNCMPSTIVATLSRSLREKFHKLPYLNIDYDGFADATRDQLISMFVCQVKEYNRLKLSKKGKSS